MAPLIDAWNELVENREMRFNWTSRHTVGSIPHAFYVLVLYIYIYRLCCNAAIPLGSVISSASCEDFIWEYRGRLHPVLVRLTSTYSRLDCSWNPPIINWRWEINSICLHGTSLCRFLALEFLPSRPLLSHFMRIQGHRMGFLVFQVLVASPSSRNFFIADGRKSMVARSF